MSLADRVLAALNKRPGQKAKEIADALGEDKRAINSLLYGRLKGKVRQDNKYCWYSVADAGGAKGRRQPAEIPQAAKRDTPLAKLCQYYLDCLAQANDQGVSVFADSKYGDPDYIEIPSFPGYSDQQDDPLSADGADAVLRKVKSSRGRKELFVGYPVRLRKHRAPSGWEGYFVEPVMLWSCNTDDHGVALSTELPSFNFKLLRWLGIAGDSNHLEEAASLNDELGLDASPGEEPDIDELIDRLRAIRPEWDWRETIDVHSLSSEPLLSKIDEQGIYNRAVLVATERSPYTQGLESELKKLSDLSEDDYRDTALGYWLNNNSLAVEGLDQTERGLIEVVPLNTEQREAVKSGLTVPLSVITGPPGTGKSQVVTSLITNAIWSGTSALFASKNNKAVDVVHDRVNGLAHSPTLLRLGSNEKNYALAEHLLSLLSTTASPDDAAEYAMSVSLHQELSARKSAISEQIETLRKARNRVDALDKPIADYRTLWGESLFAVAAQVDVEDARQQVNATRTVIARGDVNGQSLLTKAFWRFAKKNWLQLAKSAWRKLSPKLELLGLSANFDVDEETVVDALSRINQFAERLDVAESIQHYKDALRTLESMSTMEELAKESYELSEKIARNSETLWRQWVDLQPARMTNDDRRTLANYSTALQAMIDSRGEDQKAARQIANRYYRIFPKIRRLLPCWAVTSLSARGKVPFEANFFDLLIIDEASQCDIASALPLLFRAKRAVIIGDPMQLKHISTLTVEKDHRLQEKSDVSEDYASWNYSVNSLFNLAIGLVGSEGLTMLRDHHRSHADIINFSNKYFYKGRLRVATKYNRLNRPAPNEPAVTWTNVEGAVTRPSTGGAVNATEAKAMVQAIRSLVGRGYQGTIGAVTPFRAQANLIRKLLTESDDMAAQLIAADFLVDTVHRFQGDERDVMFFSPVVSDGISRGAIGFLSSNGNLFNVAITRARSMLHVVGDRGAAADSGVDYLKAFAEYVSELRTNPVEQSNSAKNFSREYPTVSHPEKVSDWERIFYTALYDEGIRPIPQFDVEQYTLDFAVFDDERKLNVEIDGERYHKDWSGELCRRDQLRNQRLIELGWEVKRFWVYQIRDESPKCVNWIAQWLQQNETKTSKGKLAG